MDALSEAVRAVRVTSTRFFSGEFSAPWRFASGSQEKIAPLIARGSDAKIGALAHLHRDPARSWTVQDLAEASGMSRTVPAERFTHLMDEPPLAYLGRWRLQLGARLFLTTNRNVQQVAYDLGYESEAVFNRAFKRAFGVPPARYRRERNAA